MLELKQVKEYLRVDSDDEDNLIISLILTAKELVEGVIRHSFANYDELPETLKQACLIAIGTMFENRQGGKNGINMHELIDLLKRLTFAYRKDMW